MASRVLQVTLTQPIIMIALLLVMGLVAGGLASHSCTTEDRTEMQLMWANVWSAQFTGRRLAIAQAVFKE